MRSCIFCVLPISLCIMSSMFIHVVANGRISFLRQNNIPFMYVHVHIYTHMHICTHTYLIVHSSLDRYFGCFNILAIVSKSWLMLQWTWECRYLYEMVISFPLDIYPLEELLSHMVVVCLISLGTPVQFFTMATLICIPTNSVWVFSFSHHHQHLSLVTY